MRERVEFIGGPWDGETREVEWAPVISVDDGHYRSIPTINGDQHRMAWNTPIVEREISRFLHTGNDPEATDGR